MLDCCVINSFQFALLNIILVNDSKLFNSCCLDPIRQYVQVISVGNAEASAAWVAIVDSQATSICFELGF